MKKLITFGLALITILILLNGCQTANFDEHSVPQDQNWEIYKNTKLGFEIKYPKTVLDISSCGCETELSNSGCMVPVKFFEKDNIVYVTKEYYYSPDCKKQLNTFDLLESNKQQSWKIVFKDIDSNEELDEFFKEIYGNKCEVGKKEPAQQDNVYNVLNYWDGKSLGKSDCFINYMSVFKYYPEGKKAVSWHIGQEAAFWSDGIELDHKMIESFRFIKKSS